jgi:rhodanese-related sulfurtransferase
VDTTRLNLGDTGTLTVTFNPNLHEEPEGRFFKTATLLTEPAMEDIPQATIWVDIDLDLGADAYELKSEHEEEESSSSYQSITPEKLGGLLEDENVWLIDVHIPEQEHIPGTDAFIPYHRIEGDPALPKDKNTPIVLYCRSGGMSRAAAEALVQDGYTNVYDLAGGKNAYDAFLDASEKSVDMRANEQVGFIQFEARTVTRQNMPELLAEFGDELNDLALDLDKTNVFLLLNNHRIDLAEFDYQNISTLDGDGAESWKPFSDAIGGHHVAGVLVFDRVAKPERLAITGLPVGEVNLVLNQM